MAMQRDLQMQISQIKGALEAQATESEARLRAATMMQCFCQKVCACAATTQSLADRGATSWP